MRRFSAKFVLFTCLTVALLLAVSALCRRLRRNVLNDQVFGFGPRITTLIVGDSHPQTSINPALLPGAKSITEGAEGYFFSYYKLRHFLNHNPQVRRVVLGFSYQNLARTYQERFITSEQHATHFLEKYFVLLDEDGRERVRTWSANKRPYYINLFKFTNGLPIQVYRDRDLLRKAVGAPLRRTDILFFGEGFYYGETSRVEEQQMLTKARQYFLGENGQYSGISTVSVEYLRKTVRLCEGRGVDLYLCNMPLHARFKELIPRQALVDFVRVKDQLVAMSPRVRYINLVNEPLPTASFRDGDHVNSVGAKAVTEKLSRLMQPLD